MIVQEAIFYILQSLTFTCNILILFCIYCDMIDVEILRIIKQLRIIILPDYNIHSSSFSTNEPIKYKISLYEALLIITLTCIVFCLNMIEYHML